MPAGVLDTCITSTNVLLIMQKVRLFHFLRVNFNYLCRFITDRYIKSYSHISCKKKSAGKVLFFYWWDDRSIVLSALPPYWASSWTLNCFYGISYAQLGAILAIYNGLCMRTTFESVTGSQTPVLVSVTYSSKSEIDKTLHGDWPGPYVKSRTRPQHNCKI